MGAPIHGHPTGFNITNIPFNKSEIRVVQKVRNVLYEAREEIVDHRHLGPSLYECIGKI